MGLYMHLAPHITILCMLLNFLLDSSCCLAYIWMGIPTLSPCLFLLKALVSAKIAIIHAMRKDIWYKFICIFASCLHWFNPLSNLFVEQAEKEHDRFNYGISFTNSFDHNKRATKVRTENILDMKKNNKLIFVIIAAALLLSTSIIFLVNIRGSSFLESLYYGDNSVLVTDPKEYGQFEDLRGYSSLDIFPQNISSSMIDEYYYSYQDTLFDPTCQIYLNCSYDNPTYEAELQRLSQISKSYNGKIQQIIYDTDNYNYPAYVTIDANNHCYEYALLTGENNITYVFLEFINEENLEFDLQYLPKNYENAITDQKKGYSIYIYYKDNGDGIWIDV